MLVIVMLTSAMIVMVMMLIMVVIWTGDAVGRAGPDLPEQNSTKRSS